MVTLDDVAALAGVSRTTASRAMNGVTTVKAPLAKSVLEAAETLGFRPNPAARSLALGRHDAIALIVPESDIWGMSNSFFASVLQGAIREIAGSEQQLVMVVRARSDSDEKFLRYLSSSHVDGALVVLEAHNTELPRLLADSGLPVVYMGRPSESDSLPVSYVDADNVGGARAAAELLVQADRRRIGVITGTPELGVTQDRLRGWRETLLRHDIADDLVVTADFQRDGGAVAMAEMLDRDSTVDGVFVMSDLMAAGALATLRERERSVPRDVSLVSFDDTVISTAVEPHLTTIAQPFVDLGALMVRTLRDLCASPAGPPVRVTLPTQVILRDSV
ncbi:LacI family DNA-binding transcriptional regulator [Microbacterium xanthum]|uniref:LacI family DNA-binding transcriptional regulator n=1 Tax=Microbacterium xanthum TaxID=3079794 RepID=UPI002AD206EE|nr:MULTISPECIES: LacI family DNA-binding transcriptional regulator [unclassified Microbacterium]MDZ8173094.1 LacI family DNA-binding transcriptional regulator [Microbacterium sp. KSW-48]MDZ8200747.1 LacI family DNA-binding transcriptional regulator [Microbacterium sp. SSW1-59]